MSIKKKDGIGETPDRRKIFTTAGIAFGGLALLNASESRASESSDQLRVFNTLVEMKNVLDLQLGDRVATHGYYTPGDGGGGYYTITSSSQNEDSGAIINLNNGLQAFLRTNGTVNVRQFGVVGNGEPELTQIYAVEDYCRKNNINIYFPAGVYDVGNARFPFFTYNNSNPKDYGNITVYGDGKNTILRTTSDDGADVLQLNAIKNITFRDFAITARLESTEGAGSNGVSITGSCYNVELRNIECFDLPNTTWQGYADGGKAFTIQYTHVVGRLYKNIRVINCVAKRCAYGFGIDSPFEVYQDLAPEVVVDGLYVEDCYRGITIAGSMPTRAVPTAGVDSGVTVTNTVLHNCQQGLILSRCYRPYINVRIRGTKDISSLQTHHLPDDSEVYAAHISFVKYGDISINGFMQAANDVIQLGGDNYTLGNDSSTEQCFLNLGINAQSATNGIALVEKEEGMTVKKCRIYTKGLQVPEQLFDPELDNSIA